MLPYRYLPLLLLLLSSCRSTRFAFAVTPALPFAADLRAGSAPLVTPPALPVADQQRTGASAPSPRVAVRHHDTQPARHRTSTALGGRNTRLWLPSRFNAPADTLPRQVLRSWHLKTPKPTTGWGKMKWFAGRLLAWTIYLTLVGLVGWLVVLAVKWGFALDVLSIAFGGIPLIILTLLLLYFVVFIGFFALVSEAPM